MGTATPTATGRLSSTPFGELLVYALTQSLSGSLVLECPDRSKHALVFQAGVPVKARVDHPSVRLGEVLVSTGAITAEARRAAELEPSSELFGQRLFEAGAIDPSSLARGLEEQLLRQLAFLGSLPAATAYAYFDGVDLLQSWGGGPLAIDVLAGIWRAVDGRAPAERVARACEGLAGKTLRLHRSSRVGRFGFGARERAVLDVLRVKPQSLAELEATGLLPKPALHQLLYVLVLTRHLDTGTQPLAVAASTTYQPAQVPLRRRSSANIASPVSAAAEPPTPSAAPNVQPAAAAAVSPAPAAPPPPAAAPAGARSDLAQTGRFLTREEIEAKLEALDRLTHYELLEVPVDAPGPRIAEAFSMLARRWHPDRTSPTLGELRESVTRVFARMTEASRVLGQAASRAEYDRSLGAANAEEDEQAQVAKVLRAAESFQKAEILLKKRDVEGAEKFARLAHMADAEQPEYAALYAWIRARRPDVTDAELEQSLATLKAASQKQPNNVKMRYYYGWVLKRSGNQAAAMKEFKFVAQNDPSNVDAARELRLHEMRKSQSGESSAKSSASGLFDRIFKR